MTSWQQGWWDHARQVRSPNFGPRPAGLQLGLIVVHSISLPPGIYGGDSIEKLFTNRLDWTAHPYFESIRGMEVSSHFVISRQGLVTQYVSVGDRAWHAGRSEWMGRPNCNDYSVGIELEGLEDATFEAIQYDVLHQLVRSLCQEWPSIQQIAGHEHIAPGRKRDPGAAFQWNRLQRPLADLHLTFPPALLLTHQN